MSEDKEISTAIITSLGKIFGETLSLAFDSYGSLTLDDENQSFVGPLVEPVKSLHRDYTLTDAGPWPSSEPSAFLLALARRELQWLESDPGKQLFKTWRGSSFGLDANGSTKTLELYLELAKALLSIIPKMYSLFPLPKEGCLPTLSHADFHYSNILVSRENPTLVTGVVDWEFAAILPLWAAYGVPHKVADYGDRLETDAEWREEKRRLRRVFGQACMVTCPHVAVIVQPEDEVVQRSLRGLRILFKVATSGVALYRSCEETKELLAEMLQCVDANDTKGVNMIRALVATFS
jgi:Phosphotransferase enzyme family